MPDAEQDSYDNEAAIYAFVAQMLRRNNWHLLEAVDLTRRVIALLRNQQWREPPDSDHHPSAGRKQTRNPIEGAALHSYSEALYTAFAGHEGDERQRQAYTELLRYILRVLSRKAPTLSFDEREELAYETMAELYYRLPPGQHLAPRRVVRIPSAFIAIVLQESWNALHRWQNAARHLELYQEAVVGDDIVIAVGDINRSTRLISEDDLSTEVERSEHSAQVRACFARTLERNPQARLQLHVVWLHIVEEQDYARIASILGMRVENVRVLYCRGCKRLRNDPEWRSLAAEFQRGQDND